ncbi:hypothetical protein [Evansella vedderi]|uniref:hypothetical protein n=1 Tax=Evansella vedderi TaxID=38282 RepID=UPI0027D8567B|nr:hypothetical protein [Evansella vedderi]
MNYTEHLVLKTKLEAPVVDSQVLFRPSIMKRLKSARKRPLTLMQAGPGYGKSTAISAFLRMENTPYVWYTVTEQDNHLSRFLVYFKEAILPITVDLDEKWLTEAFMNIHRGDEKAIYECCSHFINACVDIKEDWLFIIDDFQLVSENREINQFMKWFLMHLPQRLHIVLVSRTKIDWEFLHSMRVKGQLVEVNERDLCFSPEEIEILFEDHYGTPMSYGNAHSIFEKTEGWIMAIQMVWQRLEESNTLEEIFHDEANSMEELFEYLALDVLEKQREVVRRFLMEASIFPTLTAEICEKVLEIGKEEDLLSYVMRKNLFLHTTKQKETFRFHALFQNFLQNRLKREELRWVELHERAAKFYREKGLLEQALHHMKKTESIEKLSAFLHRHGKDLIHQGNSQLLEEAINSIDEAALDRFTRLWIVKGDMERYRCKFELAIYYYKRARELAEEQRDPVSESLALEGMACVYLDTIQPRHAQDFLKKAISLLEEKYIEPLALH